MRQGPTLFDLLPDVASCRTTRRSEPEPASPRRGVRPRPLAPADDHPGAEARFDVLFTHEQMTALNAASASFYARWGVRVNKSQLIRALVAALARAQCAVDQELEFGSSPALLKAPPTAAPADVHRRFEASLCDVLISGVIASCRRV